MIKITVSEYRTLIASRAQDIVDMIKSGAYHGPALSSVLPVAIKRLNELSEAYDAAVKEQEPE